HAPDLIVLDIHLPDFDGYEVCRRLHQHRRTRATPIVFLTERRDHVSKLQGLEMGVVDYITKPFDMQELHLRIRNTLQRAHLQPLVNPITSMPEGPLVKDRLAGLVTEANWAALSVRISGLDGFREAYGFVAADDVLRAVSLMVNNAVREAGAENAFVGHLTQTNFLVEAQVDQMPVIRERIEVRIRQSIAYFYPLKDRAKAREAMAAGSLSLEIGLVNAASGPFSSADALRQALVEALQHIPHEPQT
ncbi:MAG: response regulator, partial [Anaerolineae bacterium]|nr:response regulator [Anaerolineae bacterium]